MQLCHYCMYLGYCHRITSLIVTDAEISNPEFIRDVRVFAHGLGLTPDQWHEFVIDAYRDYKGRIVSKRGAEVFLTTEVLEHPNIRDWFKAWACRLPNPDIAPRVRKEAWGRVRVVASILRAQQPFAAQFWGLRDRAANDNEKK